MRLAFDVGPLRARPAGVGVYVRSLAAALATAVPVRDLRFIGQRPDAAGLPEAVPTLARDGRLPYPVWAEVLGGIAARRARADVAHFTDGLVPILKSCPTVVTVHDLSIVRHWRSHELRRLPRVPLVLASPRRADRVIADSRATADELMRLAGVPASKIDVVPLAPRPGIGPAAAPDVDAVLRQCGLVAGRFVLVPGTIEPRKNHVRLVAAFTRLVEQREIDDDIELVLVGGEGWGAGPALAAIEESPASRRIRRLGYVGDDELTALMTAAAAVVYVSTYEGFGLPILEAMACGAPTVTSNVSSMPEVAGNTGLLVDPYDTSDIARGLRSPLQPDFDRTAAAAAAIARASRFTWTRTAAQLIDVYRSVHVHSMGRS